MIIPFLVGGVIGAFLGNSYGHAKGYTAALVPLTNDPNLETAYRRALGTVTPGAERSLNVLLRAAREEGNTIRDNASSPRGMKLPPAPPRQRPAPPSPAATGASFYNPYVAGALFMSHGYRPGAPSFYPPPYAAGGGIFTAHGYRPVPPGFYR